MRGHFGESPLCEYMNDIGALWRRCIVVASGNEANARHHFWGTNNEPQIGQNSGSSNENATAVEVDVEENMPGFYLRIVGECAGIVFYLHPFPFRKYISPEYNTDRRTSGILFCIGKYKSGN